MNPSLTPAQLAVLLVLSEGRARVSNRTVAAEHRVSEAAWWEIWRLGLGTHMDLDGRMADITPAGRVLVAGLAKVAP